MRQSHSRSRLSTGLAMLVAAAAMLMVPAGPAGAKASPGCTAGGVKVPAGASPATLTVNDTTASTGVQVVVTITGATFTIAPTDPNTTLDSASWCLKASTKTQTGSGASGANTTILNKRGIPRAIGYVVVYNATTAAPDPFPESRAVCEAANPVAGSFIDASAGFQHLWGCALPITISNPDYVEKESVVRAACLSDGGIGLEVIVVSGPNLVCRRGSTP